MIIVSMVIATLLGSPAALGKYMVFIETAFISSVILLLGQDRLIIILFAKLIKKKNSKEHTHKYSHFILLWLLTLFFFLLCSFIGFYFIPKELAHPILLGICLSPYMAIFGASSNLLNITGRPILARCSEIVILLFFAIPLLYIYHWNIGQPTFLTIAYVMAILYSIVAIIGICIGMHSLASSSDIEENMPKEIPNKKEKEEKTQTTFLKKITKPLLLYNIHNGFFQCITLIKNIHTLKSERGHWFKQGIPLGIARFSDNIFSLVIPILAIMGVSSAHIAYASIAYLLVGYNAELSCVIRNHFIPLITPLLPEKLPAQFNSSQQAQLHKIILAIRILIFTSTAIIIAVTKPVLDLYGPEYSTAFPMVIVFIALMFLTYGWSFNRSVFTLYPKLLSFFNTIQRYRFIASLVLIPTLIWLFGIYGAFFAVGLPSLIATALQLWYLKKKSGINLL